MSDFEYSDDIESSEDTDDEFSKTAMENPFDGYGRPFSDNGNMSEFYDHDNPANNVGPYSGPSSYSINTVAPYNPPHSGEENPGQNVGPYNPPAVAPQESEEADLRTAYKTWNEARWFDGSVESIYNRALEAEQLRRHARIAKDAALEDELVEQIQVLNRTASEYDDSLLHEHLDAVPGGTVALEYDDLVDGGLVDVTSFIEVESHRIATEVAEYDWDGFKDEGARQWIAKKLTDNPGLVKHEVMAREAAIDFAKDKTMVLMDPYRRADIIDGFVTNAERYRREAAKRLTEAADAKTDEARRIETAKVAQVRQQVEDSVSDDFYPGEYVELGADYDEDGYLNIGEDDGTHLYAEAKSVIEASKKNWENFTTEGARDWFFGKASDSPAMLKHADITARAAREYATAQTTVVPDQALRSEIVRAFTESVEFLRHAHIVREASLAEPHTASAFEDIYGEEDEILW